MTDSPRTQLPNIPLTRLDGSPARLQDYAGKVLLVVNVASKCGFTPQYADLQALYDEFKPKGLEILAFPCNQFGKQEPGSAAEIGEFCQRNYGVTFPVFEKTMVNGPEAHPLYTFLKAEKRGSLGSQRIKWNFTKFLIHPSGEVLRRFGPIEGGGIIRRHLLKLFASLEAASADPSVQ